MHDVGGEEWVSPTPVSVAIVETLTAATELDEDDIDDVDEYLDFEELQALLESDDEGTMTFTIEGHELTVNESGDIEVQ